LANKLFRSYLSSPYQIHLQRNSAELIRNITVLVQQFYGEFLNAGLGLAIDLAAAGSLVILLLVIAPVPALAAGLLLIVIYTLQHRIFQRIHSRMGSENAELVREEQQALQQSFGAFKELRALRCDDHFLGHFSKLNERVRENVSHYEFSRRLPLIFGELAMMFCVSAAVLAMVVLVPDPARFLISVGILATAAFRLSPLANRIVGALGTKSRAQAGLAILAQEIEAGRDGPNAPLSFAVVWRRKIELRDVSYSYPKRDPEVLKNVNLAISHGEMVGVVGPSGSGKTTMVDILLGLLTPSRGEVLVDEKRLEADQQILAGYVPQEIFIFDDTLRRNIALGVPDDEIDDARIHELLRVVVLQALTESLPNGLDTRLGERGSALSGGQRQRIGIARALYAAPAFLVMDEATSALDLGTEQEIGETIAALRKKVTILVVAHRLSTVRMCDRLVMMAEGRIADQGTFSELAARNTQFRGMVELATKVGGEHRAEEKEAPQRALF
jgi:ATP-binding cassette subfamily C protein